MFRMKMRSVGVVTWFSPTSPKFSEADFFNRIGRKLSFTRRCLFGSHFCDLLATDSLGDVQELLHPGCEVFHVSQEDDEVLSVAGAYVGAVEEFETFALFFGGRRVLWTAWV